MEFIEKTVERVEQHLAQCAVQSQPRMNFSPLELPPEHVERALSLLTSLPVNHPHRRNALLAAGQIVAGLPGQESTAIHILGDVMAMCVAGSPPHLEALRIVCNMIRDSSGPVAAVKSVLELLQYEPSNTEAYMFLAEAAFVAGDTASAIQWVEQATEKGWCGLHFQPRIDLTNTADDVAEAHATYTATFEIGSPPSLQIWKPQEVGEEEAVLHGVALGASDGATFHFVVSRADTEPSPKIVEPTTTLKRPDGTIYVQGHCSSLVPGTPYTQKLVSQSTVDHASSDLGTFETRKETSPEISETASTLAGPNEFCLRASLGGTNRSTEYCFQYGKSVDDLTATTPWRWLPPARSACVTDHASVALSRMHFQSLGGATLIEGPDGKAGTAVRLSAPFGKDRNHMAGNGVADLWLIWYPTPHDALLGSEEEKGHAIDLRGAELTLTTRANQLNAQLFAPYAAVASRLGSYSLPPMEDVAPWSLTGQPIDLTVPEWQSTHLTFSNNPGDWSYAANNPGEQANARRYAYAPLDTVLSHHRGDIVFWFLMGDEFETPTGSIDVSTISLRYRNASVLAPGAGSTLTAWPSDALCDPGFLTCGSVGSEDHCWVSSEHPTAPQTFTWQLDGRMPIDEIRLHQHPAWPTQDVEIACSDDNDSFTIIAAETLPSSNEHPVVLTFEAPPTARFIRVHLMAGYQGRRWGLDAIDVFADAVPPKPELEACEVGEEIAGLAPGETIFYRAVARTDQGQIEGDILSLSVPVDARPMILSVDVDRQKPNQTCYTVQVSAMGFNATLTGAFTDDSGVLLHSTTINIGQQKTPRHVLIHVDHDVGVEPRGQLIASSEAGAATFDIL